MTSLSSLFERAINSPEGKSWSQQLWLNPQKDRPLIYANFKGKSTNGHPFTGELDLHLRSGKTGQQFGLGFLKIADITYDLIVFPTKRKGIAMLKFEGSLSLGKLTDRIKVAEVEVMEFIDSQTQQCSYSLRLRPPRQKDVVVKNELVSTHTKILDSGPAYSPQKRGWSERPF